MCPFLINSVGNWSILGVLCLFLFSRALLTLKALGLGKIIPAVYIPVYLTSLNLCNSTSGRSNSSTYPKYCGVWEKYTLLIPYIIGSRLVTILEVTEVPIQASNVTFLILCYSLILAYRFCLFLFVKCLIGLRLHCPNYLFCFGLELVTNAF